METEGFEYDDISTDIGGCDTLKKDRDDVVDAESEPKKPEFEIENNTLIKYNGNDTAVDIPNGVKIIANDFLDKRAVDVINIPESVEVIDDCFLGVKAINVSPENKHFSSVDGALYSKDKKVLLCVPNGVSEEEFIVPRGTEEIGECAFLCSDIDRVVLCEGVKKICGSFNGSSISEIVLPNTLEVIESSTFYQCFYLKNIILPPSLKYIGDDAFEECDSLERIHIPKNVNYIGERAFPPNCKITVDKENVYAMKRVTELSDELKKNEMRMMEIRKRYSEYEYEEY